jgi:nucleoside-diphosphate-sugar epimerase
MTSLVVGATGIVGGHIVDQLIRAGERPLALSRSERGGATDVEWLKGDLTEPAILKLPPITMLYCTAPAALLANALPRFYNPLLTRVVAFTSTSIVTKNRLRYCGRAGERAVVGGGRVKIDLYVR